MNKPWEDFAAPAVKETPPWEDFVTPAATSKPWEDFAAPAESVPVPNSPPAPVFQFEAPVNEHPPLNADFPGGYVNPLAARMAAKSAQPADALLARTSGQPMTPEQDQQLTRAVTDINTPPLPAPGLLGQAETALFSAPKPLAEIIEVGRQIQQNNRDTTLAMRDIAKKHGLDPDQVAALPSKLEQYLRGAGNTVVDTAGSFTSPVGLATLGMGGLPVTVQKAASLGFSAQMLSQTPELVQQLLDEEKKPPGERDDAKIAQLYLGALTGTGFGLAAGAHGLSPNRPAVEPAPGQPVTTPAASIFERPAPKVESIRPIEPTVSAEQVQADMANVLREAGLPVDAPKFEDTMPVPDSMVRQQAAASVEPKEAGPAPAADPNALPAVGEQSPPVPPAQVPPATAAPVEHPVIAKLDALTTELQNLQNTLRENQGAALLKTPGAVAPMESAPVARAEAPSEPVAPNPTKAVTSPSGAGTTVSPAPMAALPENRLIGERPINPDSLGNQSVAFKVGDQVLHEGQVKTVTKAVPGAEYVGVGKRAVKVSELQPLTDVEAARQILNTEGKLGLTLLQRRNNWGFARAEAAINQLEAQNEIVRVKDGGWKSTGRAPETKTAAQQQAGGGMVDQPAPSAAPQPRARNVAPAAAEVKPVSPEQQNLFATGKKRGITAPEVETAIAQHLGVSKLPPGIRVIHDASKPWGAKIEGRNQITVNAAQISTPERARAVILEEGLHGVWNDPAVARAWQSVRDLVTPEEMRAERLKRQQQGLPVDAATIREEAAIARLIQMDASRGVAARLLDVIRNVIRRVFGINLPGGDRAALKAAAIDFLRGRQEPGQRLARSSGFDSPQHQGPSAGEKDTLAKTDSGQGRFAAGDVERTKPERVAELLAASHKATAEANEILKPLGKSVHPEELQDSAALRAKLSPEQFARFQELQARIQDVHAELARAPKGVVSRIYAEMEDAGQLPKSAPIATVPTPPEPVKGAADVQAEVKQAEADLREAIMAHMQSRELGLNKQEAAKAMEAAGEKFNRLREQLLQMPEHVQNLINEAAEAAKVDDVRKLESVVAELDQSTKARTAGTGRLDAEARLKVTRLTKNWREAMETAKTSGDWQPVREMNEQLTKLISEAPKSDRVNVDLARSAEETRELISDTVDTLNMALDESTRHKARSEAVPAELTKLITDLKTRLDMLKGWADDVTDAAAQGVKPARVPEQTPAVRQKYQELESATDKPQRNFGEWFETVKRGLRYIASPVPEIPLTGAASERAATFLRGFRLFTAETNRVRKEAAARVEKVLEPLTKLRTRDQNAAMANYTKLGEQLRRAVNAGETARAARLSEQITTLERNVLDKDPFNLFRRMVLYRDIYWRGSNLKTPDGKPITLPHNLTLDEVMLQLRRLTAAVEAHPDKAAITEALRRHYQLTNDLQKSILEHGEIIPEAMRNPLYFPHHMLDTWTGRIDRVKATTEEDFRRYLIAPTGSGKLVQTDYLKAMYAHTAEVMAHNARVDLVQKYWQPYDISARLKAEHGDAWDKPWNLPSGYRLYAPFKKLPLRMDYILPREILAQKLGVLFNDGDLKLRAGEQGLVLNIKPEDLHAALVAGEKIKWALPEEIADALDGIARREAIERNPGIGHMMGTPVRAGVTFWKKTKLFAPWNYVRYEFGNTLTDVVDKVLVADPKVATYLHQAAREVWEGTKPGAATSEVYQAAARDGVFDTITAAEAGELQRIPAFEAFLTRTGAAKLTLRNFAEATMRASRFRESVFRYAKFLADVDRMESGKHPVYAGAFNRDIEALGQVQEGQATVLTGKDLTYAKAAEISLKTFGDYNSLGVIGQWLRTYAIPFWSWNDVNFRYHANQIRNIADGLRYGNEGARKTALKYAAVRVMGTLAAVKIAQEMWNQFGGPAAGLWDDADDLEANLSEADRRRAHLVMGKDKNGKTLVVYTPNAFSDVVEWVGGNNMQRLFAEYMRGQITLGQFIGDYSKQIGPDFANKLMQGTSPALKAGYELTSGKATFPDILDQRTIPKNDRWWRLAGTLTDDRVVNQVRTYLDKDYMGQPIGEQMQQVILQVRRRDPEQWAYYEARENAADWKEQKTGKRNEMGDYTAPEAQTLRNFRKAIYRGDIDNAEKAYASLLNYGYTASRLDASIRNQDPLADLNQAQRKEYLATLTPRQRRELDLANKYYEKFKALDGREKRLFPRKQNPEFQADTNLLRQIVGK